MSRSTQQRQTIEDANWTFTFGKYKGESLASVFDADPQYVEWLLDKTDFDISHSLVEELGDALRVWRP